MYCISLVSYETDCPAIGWKLCLLRFLRLHFLCSEADITPTKCCLVCRLCFIVQLCCLNRAEDFNRLMVPGVYKNLSYIQSIQDMLRCLLLDSVVRWRPRYLIKIQIIRPNWVIGTMYVLLKKWPLVLTLFWQVANCFIYSNYSCTTTNYQSMFKTKLFSLFFQEFAGGKY